MLAAEEYDERLLWDHALGTRAHTLLDKDGNIINGNDPALETTSEVEPLDAHDQEQLVSNYERLQGKSAQNKPSA